MWERVRQGQLGDRHRVCKEPVSAPAPWLWANRLDGKEAAEAPGTPGRLAVLSEIVEKKSPGS